MKIRRRRKKIVPVPFDGQLLKQIDQSVGGHFPNRSEFIREACRQMIEHLTIQEKEVLYEKGYQLIPEKSDWSKAAGKMIPKVWNDEDWA